MRNLNERLNRPDLNVKDFADLIEEAKVYYNKSDYIRVKSRIMKKFNNYCDNTHRDYGFYLEILHFFSNRMTNEWDSGDYEMKLIDTLYSFAGFITDFEQVEALEIDVNLLYRDFKISSDERDDIVDTYKESYVRYIEAI